VLLKFKIFHEYKEFKIKPACEINFLFRIFISIPFLGAATHRRFFFPKLPDIPGNMIKQTGLFIDQSVYVAEL